MADIETAIDVCQGAIRNNARITAIVATDDAESERSVYYDLSPAASAKVFAAVLAVLKGLNV